MAKAPIPLDAMGIPLVGGSKDACRGVHTIAQANDRGLKVTKQFVSEPTLSPSDDGDLRCLGTPNRIGSKLNGSCSQRPIAGEFRMRDCESR